MSDWRPIETAPLDGTVVDLWCVTRDGGAASFYFGITKAGVYGRDLFHGRVTGCRYQEGSWRPAAGLAVRLHAIEVGPTHWMPLPSAPPEEGGEGRADGAAVELATKITAWLASPPHDADEAACTDMREACQLLAEAARALAEGRSA